MPGLFTGMVKTIDNRITGMSQHTVKTIKDRMFGKLNSKTGGFLGGRPLSAADARTGAKPFAVEGDFNFTSKGGKPTGIGGALSGIKNKITTTFNNIFGSSNDKAPIINRPHRGVLKHFIMLDHRWAINGLPPLGDNIVDPPPMLTDLELQGRPTAFGSGLVGKKYAKLVLERGTYLCLAPLELTPEYKAEVIDSTAGSMIDWGNKGVKAIKELSRTASGSYNIPRYSYDAKLAPERYWKAVAVHARASMMLLGLGEYSEDVLREYLPDVIAHKLSNRFDNVQPDIFGLSADAKGIGGAVKGILSSAAKGDIHGVSDSIKDTMLGSNNFPTGKKKNNPYPLSKFGKAVNNLTKKAKDLKNKAQKAMDSAQKKYNEVRDTALKKAKELDQKLNAAVKNARDSARAFVGRHGGDLGLSIWDNALSKVGEGFEFSQFADIGGIGKHFNITDMQSYEIADVATMNLMQYITSIDMQDKEYSKNVPFVSFYCDGPIEKNYTSTSDMSESEVARITSDAWNSIVTGGLAKLADAAASLLQAKDGSGGTITGEEFWREASYHKGVFGLHLASQVAIPKVIKGTGLSETYTATIRAVAVGTDRFSLFRLHWIICQLIPFFIPENSTNSKNVIVPNTPLYCAAFCKGVMNLSRAAIESISIKTDNVYTTTEGIASDLTITLNIVPLLNVGTTPVFSRFGTDDSEPSILGAIYNPVSSFNLLATLAGHNTVFTKIPQSLWQYFWGGKVRAFAENMKNITRIASNAYADYSVNTNFNFLRNLQIR